MPNARMCPRCQVALHEARGALLVVDVCTTCGGVYFDRGELASLALKHPDKIENLENLVTPQAAPAADQPGKLKCPACNYDMDRYEYAQCKGIQLDNCSQCGGIWADDGELKAVAEHVQQGHEMLRESAARMAATVEPDPYARPLLGLGVWTAVGALAGLFCDRRY